MADTWQNLKEWPELILERLDDAGVARIVLNRPDKRNCWNRALCVAFGGASLFLLASTAYAQLLALRGTGSALGWGVWYIGISVVTAVGLNFWERVPPEVRFDLEGTPEEDRQVREAAEVIELLRAISFSWSTTPATSS